MKYILLTAIAVIIAGIADIRAESAPAAKDISHIKVYSEKGRLHPAALMRWRFGSEDKERVRILNCPDEISRFYNELLRTKKQGTRDYDVYDGASNVRFLVEYVAGPDFPPDGFQEPIGYAIIHWIDASPELIWFVTGGIERGKDVHELSEYFLKLLDDIANGEP